MHPGATHHFQMFERRQDGLQFADDRHYLFGGQSLRSVQQVHHLVLKPFHRPVGKIGAKNEIADVTAVLIRATVIHRTDCRGATGGQTEYGDGRVSVYCVCMPVRGVPALSNAFNVYGVRVPPTARRVDGRFPATPSPVPDTPHATPKQQNWWGTLALRFSRPC